MERPFFPDPVFAWTFYVVLVLILGVAAVIDLRKLIIPKWLVFTILALGVVFSTVRLAWLGANGQVSEVLFVPVWNGWMGALAGLQFALLGFLFGFVLFVIMWLLGTCGGGDVKLFAALGTWSGITLTLFILIGTVVFILLLALTRLLVSMLGRGFRPTFKDYTIKGAAQQGKNAGKQGYAQSRRTRKRLVAYSPALALSVALVGLLIFRVDLRLQEPLRTPAAMQQVQNNQTQAPLGR